MPDPLDSIVAEVLQAHGCLADPPVDLPLLAERMGVDEIICDDLVEDGRLEHAPSHTRVVLNASVSEQRRRFTFAHELGHLLLAHPTESVIARRTAPNINSEERFCDRFAAALLMPAPWMETRFRHSPVGLATVRQIADGAGVSLSAATVRTNSLLGWSRALLRWRADGGIWRLASSAGVPRHLHGYLNSAAQTSEMLDQLPTRRDIDVTLTLSVRRQLAAVPAQVSISRYRRAALALVDTDAL